MKPICTPIWYIDGVHMQTMLVCLLNGISISSAVIEDQQTDRQIDTQTTLCQGMHRNSPYLALLIVQASWTCRITVPDKFHVGWLIDSVLESRNQLYLVDSHWIHVASMDMDIFLDIHVKLWIWIWMQNFISKSSLHNMVLLWFPPFRNKLMD